MQRTFLKLVISIIGVCFFSCAETQKRQNLDTWIGSYYYEEEPVKANAGYFMAMEWTLSIDKKNNHFQGVLEVNGQQTYMKLLTDIAGDTSAVAITYNSVIEGSDENLAKGDTLFFLSAAKNTITTKWFTLEPRLSEHPPRECSCFMRSVE